MAGVLEEFRVALNSAVERILRVGDYEAVRSVGRDRLRSTVGGLMVHCAEHTQRHVGQMVTTAQVVLGMRG